MFALVALKKNTPDSYFPQPNHLPQEITVMNISLLQQECDGEQQILQYVGWCGAHREK